MTISADDLFTLQKIEKFSVFFSLYNLWKYLKVPTSG